MVITDNWQTPIAELDLKVSDRVRDDLIQKICIDGANLFDYGSDDPIKESLEEYEKVSNELIRYYLTNAYDMVDTAELNIEARAFGNSQTFGGRTYPHYHDAFDGVMIHYLTAGNEFKLNDKKRPIPLEIPDLIHDDTLKELEQGYYAIQGDTYGRETSKMHELTQESFEKQFPLQGSGKLLMQDPRPTTNFPIDEKTIPFTPVTNKVWLHPAYLWHESNVFWGNGIRVAVIITFRVLTQLIQPGQTGYKDE